MKVAKCTRNLTLIHNGNKWYLVTNKDVTKVVLVGSEYSGLICNICHFRGYCNELFSNHSICNSIDAYLTCKRSLILVWMKRTVCIIHARSKFTHQRIMIQI